MTAQEFNAEYDRLFKWRERWIRLAQKRDAGRLQSRQEAIERRIMLANGSIGRLLRLEASNRPVKPSQSSPQPQPLTNT